MGSSLNDLGLKYQTDKSSTNHDYLEEYEKVLAPLRGTEFDLLEIGVLNGASLRMWHEYFPQAHIVGIDLKPPDLSHELPRCTLIRGSQADPIFLQGLLQSYKFKVIIDDGSHLWGHQVFTFQFLFPWLQSPGVYICEDIQTSYGDYVDKYAGGAMESGANYFLRVARAVAAGKAQPVAQSEDPLMHHIVGKIRRISFIRHSVIVES